MPTPSGRISDVTRRRALLGALLIYIALDLSLPAMPGAFVFELADSVESTQNNRARAVVELDVLPVLAFEASVLAQPSTEVKDWRRRPSQVERLLHPVISWLRRPPGDAALSSEDSH